MHATSKRIKFAKEGKTPGFVTYEFWAEDAKIFWRNLETGDSGIIRLEEFKFRINELWLTYQLTITKDRNSRHLPQVKDLYNAVMEAQELYNTIKNRLDLTNPLHVKHAVSALPVTRPTSEVGIPFFYEQAPCS